LLYLALAIFSLPLTVTEPKLGSYFASAVQVPDVVAKHRKNVYLFGVAKCNEINRDGNADVQRLLLHYSMEVTKN
jgi:hypothetical protein